MKAALLLLSLLFFALLWCFGFNSTKTPARFETSSVKPDRKLSLQQLALSKNSQSNDNRLSSREKVAEILDRKRSPKDLTQLLNGKDKFVELVMRDREPHYRKLFDAWTLSQNDEQKVTDLIKDRERKNFEKTVNRMSGDISMRESIGLKKTDREIADYELITILGVDKVNQISDLEEHLSNSKISDFQKKLERKQILSD